MLSNSIELALLLLIKKLVIKIINIYNPSDLQKSDSTQ